MRRLEQNLQKERKMKGTSTRQKRRDTAYSAVLLKPIGSLV